MSIRDVVAGVAASGLLLFLVSCVSLADADRTRRADYEGFLAWHKVTAEPLRGESPLLGGKHLASEGLREIYTNDPGWSVYSGDASTPFPEGAILVKDTYYLAKDGSRGKRWNITIMRKRGPGYDPENGDWEYLTVNANKSIRFQGRIKLCIDCHLAAADSDFAFTAPQPE